MTWIFEWYNPEQDIRPNIWRQALGLPIINPDDLIPFKISNSNEGRKVRFRSLTGATGPIYNPVNEEVPYSAGSKLKFISINEAEIDLRVLFQADTQELLWNQLKPMPYLFNPLRGEGILKVTNPSIDERYLKCTCISGFKLDESTLQEKSVEASLTFYANNPYWYSNWQTTTINYDGTIIGALPILPSTLVRGDNDLLGSITLTNIGDVPTNVVFVLSGPYTDPLFKNLTTSVNNINNILELSSNGGVTTNLANPLVVDFADKSVKRVSANPPNEIENLLSKLTLNSSFWDIPTGSNTINMQVKKTDLNTKLHIIFRSAYSTMI